MKKIINKENIGYALPVVGAGLIAFSFIGAKSFKGGTILGVTGVICVISGFVIMATEN